MHTCQYGLFSFLLLLVLQCYKAGFSLSLLRRSLPIVKTKIREIASFPSSHHWSIDICSCMNNIASLRYTSELIRKKSRARLAARSCFSSIDVTRRFVVTRSLVCVKATAMLIRSKRTARYDQRFGSCVDLIHCFLSFVRSLSVSRISCEMITCRYQPRSANEHERDYSSAPSSSSSSCSSQGTTSHRRVAFGNRGSFRCCRVHRHRAAVVLHVSRLHARHSDSSALRDHRRLCPTSSEDLHRNAAGSNRTQANPR